MIDVFRYINLRFEIQHLFPTEVGSGIGDDARDARRLLASINFDLESKGNKLALLASPGMRDALTEVWVEAERRGGFDSPEFLEWAEETAQDALIALPILAGGLWVAGLTPLGPAIGVALTAAGELHALAANDNWVEELTAMRRVGVV